jgi:hypothetical protein
MRFFLLLPSDSENVQLAVRFGNGGTANIRNTEGGRTHNSFEKSRKTFPFNNCAQQAASLQVCCLLLLLARADEEQTVQACKRYYTFSTY